MFYVLRLSAQTWADVTEGILIKWPFGPTDVTLCCFQAHSGPRQPETDLEQATKKCPCHQEDKRCQSASAFQGALYIPHRGMATCSLTVYLMFIIYYSEDFHMSKSSLSIPYLCCSCRWRTWLFMWKRKFWKILPYQTMKTLGPLLRNSALSETVWEPAIFRTL